MLNEPRRLTVIFYWEGEELYRHESVAVPRIGEGVTFVCRDDGAYIGLDGQMVDAEVNRVEWEYLHRNTLAHIGLRNLKVR